MDVSERNALRIKHARKTLWSGFPTQVEYHVCPGCGALRWPCDVIRLIGEEMEPEAPAGETVTKPTFVNVDLTEMMDEGVLMAANERFFWPLGLALSWTVPDDAVEKEARGEPVGEASFLRIREWRYEDGHHESIGLGADDPVAKQRRDRFAAWSSARIASMPEGEKTRAYEVADPPMTPTPVVP